MKSTYISVSASIAIAAAVLASCGSSDSTSETVSITGFSEVAAPATDADKMAILASNSVTYSDGETSEIAYKTIMRANHQDNGETFGLLKDVNGNPITFEDGSPYICDGANGNAAGSGLDHSSILQKDGKIYMVAQFECAVGAMYGFELEQAADGTLSAKSDTMTYIDQKDGFGGWVHCAGMTTPWNSHLGSEEYPADAKNMNMDNYDAAKGYIDAGYGEGDYFNVNAKYYWGNDFSKTNAYYYGFIPEVKVENGNYSYTKHFSMGRAAWELAYVMPDQKTAYLTDDGTNVGFYMYIADSAQDLSAGTLYGAKWNQTADSDKGGEATITWIKLGHATDAEIKAIVATQPKFSDIFDTADYNTTTNPETGCPSGFTHTFTEAGDECLNVKNAKAAAFLETRRYTSYLGGTAEFRKEEGVTYNARDKKLYVAMSEVRRGMTDGKGHINVTENKCGAVYELDVASANDSEGNAIASEVVATTMKGIVAGSPAEYDATSPYAGYSCDKDGIASPDNVTFLEGSNILAIGEDTSAHPNDFVWAYDIKAGTLTRIASTPYGSETTSPFWHKDVNGFGYLTLTTQHPFGETSSSDADYALSTNAAAEKDSTIGVVGPFDFTVGDGKGLR